MYHEDHRTVAAELDREAVGIRKTPERVPEGRNDWKPHEKSMPLGSLATIVATIPAWLDMVVNMDELDINPPGGPKFRPQEWKTRRDLLGQFEASLNKGREVLQKTTDDRLPNTKWRMLAAGKLMSEQPRYVAIRDGVFNHMAHHRGQLTVYLRLNEEKVPAIYGPLMKAKYDPRQERTCNFPVRSLIRRPRWSGPAAYR